MKSVKPGRGPSLMGGVGSIIAIIFGIFWTIQVVSAGAPGFFIVFGIFFIAVGVMQAVYNFKNATGKNRFSEYDIVDDAEEADPLQQYIRQKNNEEQQTIPESNNTGELDFCPYCGAEVRKDFQFCGKCGKKLPD